ncbi:WD repeat-containing protein 89 isoform X1 [Corythoichthys intestinalis]|uniref:WD repeat-containing protein 89 isoform X1 n=1 Tax=Corythoichthys intestinalis TaxID=161448 RepID=UPI0025A51740|nr:WD repeat-containing protein 89 isoform X1 [Corythoichthys intestinalis]
MAGPNVEAGHIWAAGRSLRTTGARIHPKKKCRIQVSERGKHFYEPTFFVNVNIYRGNACDAKMEKLARLSLAAGCISDSDRSYVLDVALPPSSGVGVAASRCDRSLRLHDEATLRPVGEYRGHTGRVCGLTFARTRSGLLYSASADGTVRGWDVRRPGTDTAQLFRGDPSHVFCSFDLSCGDALLCAGTSVLSRYSFNVRRPNQQSIDTSFFCFAIQLEGGDSFLVFWDSRKAGSAPLGVYSESHGDDVTQVRFHPCNKDRLASGGTDGLVNVFDLRRGSEEEALLRTCDAGSSVATVCWGGEGGRRLLCLTHDEGVRLWDLDLEQPHAILDCPDARRLTVTSDSGGPDYLLGGARLEGRAQLLVAGGDRDGSVLLMECDVNGLRHLGTLRGGHAATVRCFAWDEGRGALFTGGEDARLSLWKAEGGKSSAFKLKSAATKKHRRANKPPY